MVHDSLREAVFHSRSNQRCFTSLVSFEHPLLPGMWKGVGRVFFSYFKHLMLLACHMLVQLSLSTFMTGTTRLVVEMQWPLLAPSQRVVVFLVILLFLDVFLVLHSGIF